MKRKKLRRFRVGYENRAATVGGNIEVWARDEREASRIVRRGEGWLRTRINSVVPL